MPQNAQYRAAVLQAAGSRSEGRLDSAPSAFDALSFVAVLIQLVKGRQASSQLEVAFPAPSPAGAGGVPNLGR